MQLVPPTLDLLPGYRDALRRGWSPDNMNPAVGLAELARIEADPAAFVAGCDDREARGAPITLPDGSTAARIPGYYRWIFDGEFCGLINIRWQPGTVDLPYHVLGHIGYTVVPWKQGRGYATAALRAMLPEAAALGLPYVELTTDVDNFASQKVITANGGVLQRRFIKPPVYGPNHPGLLWRITLDAASGAADGRIAG